MTHPTTSFLADRYVKEHAHVGMKRPMAINVRAVVQV